MLLDRVVSVSGRPPLLPGEVERTVAYGVEVRFAVPGGVDGEIADAYGDMAARVTSHRLLFTAMDGSVGARRRRDCAVPLAAVANAEEEKRKGGGWMGRKGGRTAASLLHIRVRTGGDSRPLVWRKEGSEEPEEDIISLVFSGGEDKAASELLVQINASLKDQAWARDASASMVATGGAGGFSTSAAGITGILRRQTLEGERQGKVVEDSFKDLAALMDRARDMVAIAEKLREAVALGEQQAEKGDAERLQGWLLQMGMTVPVTRESTGALFHQELARELAEFLRHPLKESKGIMTMTDVYCLVNRARGSALVSPEDVVQATTMWPKLGIPLTTRRFDSGVLVVQEVKYDDNAACEAILRKQQLYELTGRGLSLNDIARGLDITVLLAKEYIAMAEKRGLLCRDESPGGVRYYENFFSQAKISFL